MEFISQYVAHQPDANGYVSYSAKEHEVWQTLYHRQANILPGRAATAYLEGLDKLALSSDKIPQLPEVNQRLMQTTGFEVAPVEALISARAFFE